MKRRVAGFALNAFLRASIAAFLVDTLRHPHDPRYEGKAIPIRNLLVVGGLSLTFPLLALWQRRRPGKRPGGGAIPSGLITSTSRSSGSIWLATSSISMIATSILT